MVPATVPLRPPEPPGVGSLDSQERAGVMNLHPAQSTTFWDAKFNTEVARLSPLPSVALGPPTILNFIDSNEIVERC